MSFLNIIKSAASGAAHTLAPFANAAKDTAESAYHVAAIVPNEARTVVGLATGNRPAATNAFNQAGQGINIVKNFAQAVPRQFVQLAESVNPAGGNVYQRSFTPSNPAERFVLGSQPIPSMQNVYNATKAQGGPARALSGAFLTALMDAAALKGTVESKPVQDQAGAFKDFITGNPRPFPNVSDAEAQAALRVRRQMSGWGDVTQPGDTQIYQRVQKKIGAAPNDHEAVDNMLGALRTYNARKAALEGGYVKLPSASSPNEGATPETSASSTQPAGQPKSPLGEAIPQAVDRVSSLVSNSPSASKVKPSGFTTSVKNSPAVSPQTRFKVSSTYTPTKNAQLMANSQKLLQGGIDKATVKVMNDLSQATGRLSPQSISDAISVAKAHDAAGNFDQASTIYDRLATHATTAGQKVQAFSLLENRSPDGLGYSAIKTLKQAGVDTTKGDLKNKIGSAVDAIKQTNDGTPERSVATQKLVKLVNQNLPRTKAQAAVGIWRAGLLTGPETLAKVGVSHLVTAPLELASRPASALVDRIASLATGKRAFTASPSDLKTFGQGAVTGAKAIGTKLRTGVDLPGTGGFDETFGSTPKQTRYEEMVGRLHGSLFKPNYTGAYQMSLADQARVAAINQGLKGAERDAFIKNFVANPSKDVIATAKTDAENFTNMQRTAGGELANRLQSYSPGGVPIGKLIAPFTRIPTAIASKGIVDWTPLGIGKAAVQVIKGIRSGNFDQRAFSQTVGRSLTGSAATTAVGFELMKNGRMTLKAPADPKQRALWAAEGKQANSIKIGNKWISLNALGPAGIALGLGGAFQSAVSAGASSTKAVTQAVTAAGGLVADQPYFKGISGIANALSDPTRYGMTFVQNTVGSVIPAAVSQTARGFDKTQRAYPSGIVDKLKSEIPGQREKLPAQRDVFGTALPGSNPSGSFVGGVAGTVNPFYPSSVRNGTNPVVIELQRLYDTLGSSASPNIAPPHTPFTVQGVHVKPTPQQLDQFIAGSGPVIQQGLANLISNPGYAKLTDDQKVAQINKIIAAARSAQLQKQAPTITGSGYLHSGPTNQSVGGAIGTYLKALVTAPWGTVQDIAHGQHIVGVQGHGLIVGRPAEKSTQQLIKARGGSVSASGQKLQLDHVVPLEVGGTNAVSNLRLITQAQDNANNAAENFLAGQIKNGAIDMKRAQQLIVAYKNGSLTGQQLFAQAHGTGTNPIPDTTAQHAVLGGKSLKSSKTTKLALNNPKALGTQPIKAPKQASTTPKVPKNPAAPKRAKSTTTYDASTKTWTITSPTTGRVTQVAANGTRTVINPGTRTRRTSSGSSRVKSFRAPRGFRSPKGFHAPRVHNPYTSKGAGSSLRRLLGTGRSGSRVRAPHFKLSASSRRKVLA